MICPSVTASMSPRPMYGGPDRSPIARLNPVGLRCVTGSTPAARLGSSEKGGSGSGRQAFNEGRVWCVELAENAVRPSIVPVAGWMSANTVNAAVRPIPLNALIESAGRPPPVAMLNPTKLKLVGVVHPPRETWEEVVTRAVGPAVGTVSAEFM